MPEYTITIEGKEYDVDAPNDRVAYKWAKSTHDKAAKAFKAKVAADEAEWRAKLDPTAGMSALDKARANLGAGFASFGQGAQQLLSKVGIMAPVSDEEIREKRARDEALAKSTETGLGGKYVPSIGTALQFAGEVAPTLAIPAGAFAQGARALPLVGRLAAGAGAPIIDAAIAGGLSGALRPTTEDESKLLNTAIGAASGAVLPAATAAYRGIRGGLTAAGGMERAPHLLKRALGDKTAETVAATEARLAERAGQSSAGRAIPESLAEASGNIRAAQLESALGKDPATNEAWAIFKRAQNVARHEAVQKATREAEQEAGRKAVRAAVTDPMREAALAAARREPWFHEPVVEAAQAILKGEGGASSATRRMVNEVMQNIDERATSAITPERLYRVRKELVDRLHAPQAFDDLSAAVKASQVETRQMIKAIDDALNQASGGRYGGYMQEFARQSRDVDAAKAAQKVREVFGREGIPEIGGAPEVTTGRLGRAIEASRGSPSRDYPLALSPSAREGLAEVAGNLKRANEVQASRKMAGIGGAGGSQTSTDLALDSLLSHLGAVQEKGPIGAVVKAFKRKADDAAKEELTRLLQNPEAALQALRALQQAGRPLSPAQELALQLLPRAIGTSSANVLTTEQVAPYADIARTAAIGAALRAIGLEQ
jgi:hypothetical protein